MEFDVLWDDKARGDIRLCGSFWAYPRKRLLGLLPIYVPDVNDDFIMSPDGRFIDEDETPPA
jgi:hypothetical protein